MHYPRHEGQGGVAASTMTGREPHVLLHREGGEIMPKLIFMVVKFLVVNKAGRRLATQVLKSATRKR